MPATQYPWQFGLGGSGIAAPTITSCSQSVGGCISWIFSQAFTILIWLAGVYGVIKFIWAGILYISGGEENLKKAKAQLIYGAIGLVVALSAFALVRMIEYTMTHPVSFFTQSAYAANSNTSNPLDFSPPTGLQGVSGCNVPSIFRGGSSDPQLLENCLIGFLAGKVLPVVYTISLLFTVGIITWMGFEYAKGGSDVASLHKKLLWAIIGTVVTVIAFSAIKAIEISLTH